MEKISLFLISSLQEDISKQIEDKLARDEERYYQKRKRDIKLDRLSGDAFHRRLKKYNDPKQLDYLSRLAKINSRMRKDRAKLDRYEAGTKDKYKNENPFLPLILSSSLKKSNTKTKPKIGFKK